MWFYHLENECPACGTLTRHWHNGELPYIKTWWCGHCFYIVEAGGLYAVPTRRIDAG